MLSINGERLGRYGVTTVLVIAAWLDSWVDMPVKIS
jgi:hypothetical protein